MQRLTINTSSLSYVDGGDKERNLQAACEALAGVTSSEGEATWTAGATTLTVTDTRAKANSRISLSAGMNTPNGTWAVTTRNDGSFVITSSDEELAGTLVWYTIINK